MRKLVLALGIAFLMTIPARAEQKNVQVLTNLSDAQLSLAMNDMAASLGVHCDGCHVLNEQTKHLDFPDDSKQEKKTAREMLRMVLEINEKNFKGRPQVGCYTCHLGKENPSSMVKLPLPPDVPRDPKAAEARAAERKTYPTAKDVLAKYVAAIGGEPATKALSTSSVTAKGVRIDAAGHSIPFEAYDAGGKLLVRSTPADGQGMTQMSGPDAGWLQGRQGVRTFTGADATLTMMLARSFDPVLPNLPDNARVFGKDTIDGHEAWTVGSQIDEHTRQRVWFDTTTGLPLRRVITVDSPVGRIPTQTDFEDYRDVAGVKVPFTVRVSAVAFAQNATRKYSSIEFGAPVDAKMFDPPK